MAAHFYTTCVNCPGPDPGEAIRAMQDSSKSVTRRTFQAHVDRSNLVECERSLGYDTGTERGGLRMSNDWHVDYRRGTFRGQSCWFFVHSAIEWIFLEE